MIKNIEHEIIWNGRKTGGTWFHPRATRLPDGSVFMVCQDITGSDNFGQAHWSKTTDNGKNWSDPKPIPAFARTDVGGGFEEGVCDVVPEYHAPSGKVLLMGHNVFYKDDVLFPGAPEGFPNRHSVYCVSDENGNIGERQELIWDDPRTAGSGMCGCAQRYTLDSGDVIVPLTFAPTGRKDRSVTTVRYSFDGENLSFQEAGRELRLEVNRGLLEPSITKFGDLFYLTIRAEDNHGYVTTSTDGLNWNDIKPWTFDDGESLEMSTTQQRWLTHSDGLFLVYTRKAENNYNVARWRAPLYVAQVNTEKNCLIHSTERIALPLRGDGTQPGDVVARMGNFHVTNVSQDESWITVGESRPNHGWHGDTLLARVYWEKPNLLV
jgi:hypothetical protein